MRPPILYFLFSDLKYLKGIGPVLSEKIARLCGSNTVFNLLCHKPYAIIDRTYMPRISEAEDKRVATFKVLVESYEEPKIRRLPFKVICRNDSGVLQLVFFKARPDMINSLLPIGEERIVSGRVEHYKNGIQITHPDRVAPLDKAEKIIRIEPQYPLSAGVTQKKLQDTVLLALEKIPDLPEWVETPPIPFKQALIVLHNPQSEEDLSPNTIARKRLAYDELLANQITQGLVSRQATKTSGVKIAAGLKLYSQLKSSLPFKLTGKQEEALGEILGDMQKDGRMFRLLQGDVGSGKTVVGLLAMMPVIEAGKQAVFMAPTTILARQHKEWFDKVTAQLGLKIELLTGNEKGKKREEILRGLKDGEINILIGTHALLQDWVEFKELGLIIIDEQQRFGVMQRLKLSQKNERAHILLMTATPIPRSLTIAHYGEMEISRLTEKPAGRMPVETLAAPIEDMGKIRDSIKRAMAKGEKIFWICPLVEESEKSDLAAAKERYEFFAKEFGDKVGLIHGRMKEAEKTKIMEGFLSGEHQLLVATTVVEVGIDVRDATVMFIEHAERFGLSQLHQLRGRIGRGDRKSTCILLYTGRLGEESSERLRVMKKTDDGFIIAEEDLRIRGAGDMLGTRQSGFSEFRFAQMPEHQDLLYKARDEARDILRQDPQFKTQRGENLKVLLSLFEYDESINYISAG